MGASAVAIITTDSDGQDQDTILDNIEMSTD
jgi:hypothetical protein